jgi:diguanylate cyclase (GGDEF)-like protein/PAS domain S-box-containing protein
MTAPTPRFLTWQSLSAYMWLDTAVWVFDAERSCKLWANPPALELWKAESLDELVARDYSDQSPAAKARTAGALECVKRGEIPEQFWTFYPRGEPLQVSVRITGILTEDGRLALLFEAKPMAEAGIPPDVARRVEAFRHTGSLISLHDDQGRALTRNPAAIEAFGPVNAQSTGSDLAIQVGSDDTRDDLLAKIATGAEFHRRVLVRTRLGLRWHDLHCRPLNDPATGERILLLDAQDVTEAQRVHERLGVERIVLEMVSLGRPLREVIDALIHGIETILPGLKFSVLELRDGRLYGLSAPSLPEAYRTAIEGVSIGPKVGSCGTAAFLGEPVIVADVATDPRWQDYRDLALSHGLRACWSIPITAGDGTVLGAFAAYHSEPRTPTDEERSVIESARHIAAIAIERDRTQAAIEQGRGQLQMILDAMPISIAYVDEQLRYHFVNRAFEQWFGTTRAQAIGSHTPAIIGPELFSAISPYLQRVMTGEEVRYEAERVGRDGKKRYVDVHYLPHVGQDGRVLGHFGIVHDITTRKQNEHLLEYLATHDQLTGLPNRNLLSEHMQLALSRGARAGYGIGVLFVDLDRFKYVNDTLGHDAGDRLLKSVAERFRTNVRGADMVARLGGDEFVVLMDELHDVQEAAALARKLLSVLHEPFPVDGHDLYVTASIGVAVSPGDGLDPASLLKHADVAMYRAKAQGKNDFQFFSAEATAASFEHLMLENALRKAVERNEFVLHFQPIVDLLTGRTEAVETLVRWRHPDLGLVPPAKFIPLAEETGLIVPIGAWVLEEACRQIARLGERGIDDLRVAVNLSPKQFRERDLASTVERALAQSGLEPRRLGLEVTESSMMENPESAAQTLARFREMGVKISIDDFGTGYSSLSFVKRFPIDALKVDQSFIRDIVEDEDDASITRAIIALGRSLRLDIVAEGVESASQLTILRAEGCHKAQGYYFSRPVPADALADWLEAGGALNTA